MTPIEKAKEIFDTMSKQTYSFQEYAGAHYSVEEVGYEAGKKCALVASELCYQEAYKQATEISLIRQTYWEQVKAEIIKL